MTLKVTILGCGASAGVPAIGNHWGNCDPAEPKNRRTRSSIAVQSDATTLVVDTGPDFREQLNRADIRNIDAVLYTHSHGDHVSGMDDLRVLRLRHKKLIDIYADEETLADMKVRFNYSFEERAPLYPQVVVPHLIAPAQFGQSFTIGDIGVVPYDQDHGTCATLGFRFGSLAYSTDVVRLSDRTVDILQGIDTWIVDAAGYRMDQNFVHLTLRQLYELNERVGAKKVYLTHMTPAMDYKTLLKELPEGYAPAYDGLVLSAVTAPG